MEIKLEDTIDMCDGYAKTISCRDFSTWIKLIIDENEDLIDALIRSVDKPEAKLKITISLS